jgi:HTH-type transcriptional regulator/antitoxin HigA
MDVTVRPIRDEADYRAALAKIDRLINVPEGSPEADRLDVLSVLVADYEDKHHAIEPPDPITYLEGVMEFRGLTRKDLEPYIGDRPRVADILNRRRPLTMAMIRRLSAGLGLRAEVLIQRYETVPAPVHTAAATAA